MTKGVDILLVNMPYTDVVRPSAGLGLLKAILDKAKVRTRVIEANLRFWERVGLYAYDMAGFLNYHLADWSFSAAAFPELDTDQTDYVEDRYQEMLMLQADASMRHLGKKGIIKTMLNLRKEAARFIDELARELVEENPAIIGCSTTFMAHVSSLALLRRVRELDPGIVTMMGGANCESGMGLATHRSFEWVDYVVSGEADEIITGLVKGILQKGRELEPASLPLGVLAPGYRKNGYPEVKDHVTRATAMNLAKAPPPDYSSYFDALKETAVLKEVVKPCLPIEASRGCWWAERKPCTFCGLNSGEQPYRRKLGEQILAEMDHLAGAYGVKKFRLVDNAFDLRLFYDLVPVLIERGAPYELFGDLRSTLTRPLVKKLKQAGFTSVMFGIENLETEVQSLMGKGGFGWLSLQLLKWCRQEGLHTHWIYLYDVPGEDPGWYQRAARLTPLISHLWAPLTLCPVRFIRFSRYHKDQSEFGLNLHRLGSYDKIYPLDGPDLDNLAYFFEDEVRLEKDRIAGKRLTDIPGYIDLWQEVSRWQVLQAKDAPPQLTMENTSEGLLIRDTRPQGVMQGEMLNGLLADICLACDQAPLEEKLIEQFKGEGYSEARIRNSVAELMEKGLIWPADQRLVGLALWHPLPGYIKETDFPGGILDKLHYQALEHFDLVPRLDREGDI